MSASVGAPFIASGVETITPEYAMELLKRNENNRQLRPRLAQSIARDIRAGRWQLNGETIILDDAGNVLDGQHRLYAVVLAEKEIQTLVVRGVSRDATTTVDTGVKRLASDVLGMNGEANRHQLASIARRILLWDEGYRLHLSGGSRITTAHELIDYVEAHPELRPAAAFAANTFKLFDTFPSVVGMAHVLFTRVDETDARLFMEAWRSGADLAHGSPVLALRNMLRANVIGGRIRLLEHEQLGFAIIAWNHWRKGREVTRLQTPKGGFTLENYPAPK